ncbi:MAG: FkbM family methyltransferase [Acidimicrobiales bacterium]|nr:FkbM family methyltransferase [Acidimicrobiales bacterium]
MLSNRVARESSEIVNFIWNHPANRSKRFTQLARAVNFQLRARMFNHRVQAAVGKNGKVWVELHRTGATKALYANPPDWPEMVVWENYLKEGDAFYDVGANIGVYTVFAACLGANVTAFEPAKDTVALLYENIELNRFTNVKVFEAAASDTKGQATFTSNLDCVNRFDPDGIEKVETVLLDDIIGSQQVSGMKIDVEGYEQYVLQGAKVALSEHRIGLIQIEWNDMSTLVLGEDRTPTADLLKSCGYELLRPDNNGVLIPTPNPEGTKDIFARPKD